VEEEEGERVKKGSRKWWVMLRKHGRENIAAKRRKREKKGKKGSRKWGVMLIKNDERILLLRGRRGGKG
jgi:hypothetical protein